MLPRLATRSRLRPHGFSRHSCTLLSSLWHQLDCCKPAALAPLVARKLTMSPLTLFIGHLVRQCIHIEKAV